MYTQTDGSTSYNFPSFFHKNFSVHQLPIIIQNVIYYSKSFLETFLLQYREVLECHNGINVIQCLLHWNPFCNSTTPIITFFRISYSFIDTYLQVTYLSLMYNVSVMLPCLNCGMVIFLSHPCCVFSNHLSLYKIYISEKDVFPMVAKSWGKQLGETWVMAKTIAWPQLTVKFLTCLGSGSGMR